MFCVQCQREVIPNPAAGIIDTIRKTTKPRHEVAALAAAAETQDHDINNKSRRLLVLLCAVAAP